MGRYELKEIIAYEIKGKIICPDCADKYYSDELTENSIISEEDLDKDEVLFCDEDKKKIW